MRQAPFSLDLTICVGESFFEGAALGKVGSLLWREAEPWAANLHIWREGVKSVLSAEQFVADVRRAATERGSTFRALRSQHGPGIFDRQTGSVELRGANDTLFVVVQLDDWQFAPSAGRWLWGNTVSLHVRETRERAAAAIEFVRRFVTSACEELSPWYARGHLVEEWVRKNVSRDGGGIMATGLDASRYLPGLYWMNFFGRPYADLIGRERLQRAPAHEISAVDDGVLLYLASVPELWETSEYSRTESTVLAHVGPEYFFDSRTAGRRTLAPQFRLEAQIQNPRFS